MGISQDGKQILIQKDRLNQPRWYIRADKGSIDSLEGIAHFRNLRYLVIIGNEITDINPILELKNLIALRLDYNPITSIEGIEALENLQFLGLQGTDVSDISPAFNIGGLQTIKCAKTGITGIEGISKLEKLAEFDARGTKLSDAEEVFECKKLARLELRKTNVRTLEGISECPGIRFIDLSETRIRSVGYFETDEVNFSCSGCPIKDFSFLSGATKFEDLSLSGHVKDSLLPAIEGKPVYYNFDWIDCDIEALSELTFEKGYLETLSIGGETLKSLAGLEEFSSLGWFNLRGSPNVRDLRPLLKLPELRQVSLDETHRAKAETQLKNAPFEILYSAEPNEEPNEVEEELEEDW